MRRQRRRSRRSAAAAATVVAASPTQPKASPTPTPAAVTAKTATAAAEPHKRSAHGADGGQAGLVLIRRAEPRRLRGITRAACDHQAEQREQQGDREDCALRLGRRRRRSSLHRHTLQSAGRIVEPPRADGEEGKLEDALLLGGTDLRTASAPLVAQVAHAGAIREARCDGSGLREHAEDGSAPPPRPARGTRGRRRRTRRRCWDHPPRLGDCGDRAQRRRCRRRRWPNGGGGGGSCPRGSTTLAQEEVVIDADASPSGVGRASRPFASLTSSISVRRMRAFVAEQVDLRRASHDAVGGGTQSSAP